MKLRLISNQEKYVDVDSQILKISHLIETIIDGFQEDDYQFIEIPLLNVSFQSLLKIVEFADHYYKNPFRPIPQPIPPEKSIVSILDPWYYSFVSQFQQNDLYDLLRSANYMDIEPLLNLICATLACLLRQQSVTEIKNALAIQD